MVRAEAAERAVSSSGEAAHVSGGCNDRAYRVGTLAIDGDGGEGDPVGAELEEAEGEEGVELMVLRRQRVGDRVGRLAAARLPRPRGRTPPTRRRGLAPGARGKRKASASMGLEDRPLRRGPNGTTGGSLFASTNLQARLRVRRIQVAG